MWNICKLERVQRGGPGREPHILIVSDFVGLVAHLGVALQDGVHVCAGVLEKLGV